MRVRGSHAAVFRRGVACLTALARERDGSALLYTTISLPVLFGFALLTIDGGRYVNLHTTLQHAADGLALAGAGELDRAAGACDRAVTAMTELVKNDQRFGEAGLSEITISDVTYRFLTELPPDDTDPIPSTMEADPSSCDAQARFVEVTVDPQNMRTIFPVTFLGSNVTARTNATAVAGFDLSVCEYQPMFMCNPFEPAGNTDVLRTDELYAHLATRANRRRLIEFKTHSGTETWSPGNFGYLEAALGPGANELGEAMARTTPAACYVRDGLYTKPGNTTVIRDAFNVRFDLYHGSYKWNEPDYRPARNVRKGYPPDSCGSVEEPLEPPNMGLPRDSCFLVDPNTCGSAMYGRVGAGDWDFDGYWSTNFGTTAKPINPDTATAFDNTNPPTRYEIYRYEIDLDLDGDGTPDGGGTPGYLLNMASPGGELGTPECNKNAADADDNPDRRTIYGAIFNCIAQPMEGGASGPYTAAFGKFFMTEPLDESQASLWLELIDLTEPDTDGSDVDDLVQLYR